MANIVKSFLTNILYRISLDSFVYFFILETLKNGLAEKDSLSDYWNFI
jgi:hypothetical protein